MSDWRMTPEEREAERVQSMVDTITALRAALDQERADKSDLEDVLHRNGFVRCDAPACNCGSWHARYGLRERMDEISDALAEAGHPLDNSNGHIAREALRNLIAERDLFRRETVALAKDALAMKDALDNIGDCPSGFPHYCANCDRSFSGNPTALLSGRGEGHADG